MMKFQSHVLGGAVVLSSLLVSELATAQDAPAPAPAAPPAAEAPPAVAAPAPPPAAEPAPAPAAEPPPLPAPAPVPEAAAEAAPAAENPFKVTVGAGIRAGLRFQNPGTANDDGDFAKLNDQFLDELNAELRFSGKVTDIIGWTANLTVDGRTRAQSGSNGAGAPINFQAQALDLIAQLDLMDEFHVWMGRMLTPTDRSNFSGSWFMAPWNYSGILDAYYGPRGTEEVGRETGVTVWGDIEKGKFKYYAMMGDLDSNFGNDNYASQSPLWALRAQYAFIGAEPGFYGSSTYYGGQDIVALGAAFQYQKDYQLGSSAAGNTADNLVGFNADLLAEFKTGAGTPGIEAAFYHQTGDNRVGGMDNLFYVVPGFTTDEVLPANGKLNATVRYQMAMAGKDSAAERKSWAIEPSVAYLFKDYFAKLQLTYTYMKTTFEDEEAALAAMLPGDNKAQFIQLGFQIQQ